MIVMNLFLNNFLAFINFNINFSYPKRLINSFIEDEFLLERPNFRYKKIAVIMGANASGKTSIGQMLNNIFNFMMRRNVEALIKAVCNKKLQASFSIDFIPDQSNTDLFRLETIVKPFTDNEEPEILARLRHVKINKADNYKKAAARLSKIEKNFEDYINVTRDIPRFGYFFSYPHDVMPNTVPKDYSGIYRSVLEIVLKLLDPSIERVDTLKEARNSYNIHMLNGQNILIQEGKTVDTTLLSSGTKAGIAIADILTALKEGKYGFYYCDERFSYIQSEIEKHILSIMISSLGHNNQLLFTTHNSDILDISLPKHSYIFLRKKIINGSPKIFALNAENFLKRNTSSLRQAVENDLFSFLPDISSIYNIENI